MTHSQMLHFYRYPILSDAASSSLLERVNAALGQHLVVALQTEYCYNCEVNAEQHGEGLDAVTWLLSETFEQDKFGRSSFLSSTAESSDCWSVEIGPRLSFSTAWSTNAVSVCQAIGLHQFLRIERSRRYVFRLARMLTDEDKKKILSNIHDRMTEMVYPQRLHSFHVEWKPDDCFEVDVMHHGIDALRKVSKDLGLAFDEFDLQYYTELFKNKIGRNPTSVECFDLAQSNSEHSRHWFFSGKMILDDQPMPQTLFQMVKSTQKANPHNSIIAYHDNSSSIRGYPVAVLRASGDRPGYPGRIEPWDRLHHPVLTAETHNFPTGIAPFPGAETGTGGRIRDVQATGRGTHVLAGTVGYSVGNLLIPSYPLPWEDASSVYPPTMATPLQIEIDASNGASDYGNKFGEPVICGFTRSFGLKTPNGDRREYVKPIMFSAGIGILDDAQKLKIAPEKGMKIVKLGGPAYRIGLGGGAASSMAGGDNSSDLDFNAVQRGDAEMEQKLNRAIRACIELGNDNPILSIHDQGAGGSGNVLKEICAPCGGLIDIRSMVIGDKTMSVLELWGAEYQEQNALLVKAEHETLLKSICEREKIPVAFVGDVTGDGRVIVIDREATTEPSHTPVNLELKHILGDDMPQKEFKFSSPKIMLKPLTLPNNLTVYNALDRVFRLLGVGCKLFLTNKVDRSVTGLIAQQQCVGPLQLPLSNVAVTALSYLASVGAATAVGEQPIKGLVNAAAGARMSVGEALTNLVWAHISSLNDVKASGNWMWAAKLPGEGVLMYNACKALADLLISLGVAIDGGKDSLSMAARCPDGEVVKSPGTFVLSCYVTCPDITATITPDLKLPGVGVLGFIDLGFGKNRMGGSALAQCFSQIGDVSPDVDSADALKAAFNAIQTLIIRRLITAGHDRSDGGLITTLCEMAFGGNCGININIEGKSAQALEVLFNEELGLVFECHPKNIPMIESIMKEASVSFTWIGSSMGTDSVRVSIGGVSVVEAPMTALRSIWAATSFQLERRQCNLHCVVQEEQAFPLRRSPPYALTYTPTLTDKIFIEKPAHLKPRVAVIREEGSNGDREMSAALYLAGFDVWDITMSDLVVGRAVLDTSFRGVVFVGGFSYADVLDSAKGWAGTVRYHPGVRAQFTAFFHRPDTFSLGVCNGCQLMALLGWVPGLGDLAPTDDVSVLNNPVNIARQPRFIHNESGRYESRFVTLKIEESSASKVMLAGMTGSVLGCWISHGEGKAYFPYSPILDQVKAGKQIPVTYVDDDGFPTQRYPFNPNGSTEAIASLCSADGRHLAMMPHPERTALLTQWPYMPMEWRQGDSKLSASPWIKMFQNAREWCDRV